MSHSEITPLKSQEFKADEKLSREFSFLVEEAGTYILDAHYTIAINSSNTEDWFSEKLDDIEITVTLSKACGMGSSSETPFVGKSSKELIYPIVPTPPSQ